MNLLRCVDVILNEIGKGGFICVLNKTRVCFLFAINTMKRNDLYVVM
jgi:hypothetical protein